MKMKSEAEEVSEEFEREEAIMLEQVGITGDEVGITGDEEEEE